MRDHKKKCWNKNSGDSAKQNGCYIKNQKTIIYFFTDGRKESFNQKIKNTVWEREKRISCAWKNSKNSNKSDKDVKVENTNKIIEFVDKTFPDLDKNEKKTIIGRVYTLLNKK